MISAVAVFAMACGALATPRKPHLVFFMVDDWGYYEAGFKGNSNARTPFMDLMLAKDALLIERHYSYRFCSLSPREPATVSATDIGYTYQSSFAVRSRVTASAFCSNVHQVVL